MQNSVNKSYIIHACYTHLQDFDNLLWQNFFLHNYKWVFMLSQQTATTEKTSTQLTSSEFQKIREGLSLASREQLAEVMKVALRRLYGANNN